MATAPSLFGATPDELRQQQAAALDAQALQYAQMDPFQRATMGIYRGANQLGGAIGGMLGGQDPQMAEASKIQQIVSQHDYSTPEGLLGLARAFAGANLPRKALEASQAAQAQQKAALEGRKTEAEIGKANAEAAAKGVEKNTTEVRNAMAAADADGFARDTPEWKASFKAKFKEITTPAGKSDKYTDVGLTPAGVPVHLEQLSTGAVRQFTFAANPNTGEQIKVNYTGPVQTKTPFTKVEVDARTVGEKQFSKDLGGLDASAVSDAMKARSSAISTLSALEKLSSLSDSALISGSFASGRVGATNLLNTLGLTSSADAARLATSENYQKVAGDVVLQTLGGKLGAGFSNEDRKFIEALVPQLENSPQARRQLIQFMATKNRTIVTEANRLEDYARTNRGLGGFKATIPFKQGSALSQMTDDQLTAAIAAERARLKREGGK